MQRFLLPVFAVYARNVWHNDPLLCHKYEEKRVADYESRCLHKQDQQAILDYKNINLKKVENLTFFPKGLVHGLQEVDAFFDSSFIRRVIFRRERSDDRNTSAVRRLAFTQLHNLAKRDPAISVPVDFYFKFSKIFLRIRSDFNRHLDRKYSAKVFLILKKVTNDDVSTFNERHIKSKHKCCCLWNRQKLTWNRFK